MEEIPLSWQFATLGALLICSGFFSIAETAMMACNRYRLRHLAAQGHRGARLALALLAQTDKLLGVILLGNNLINAGAATLVSVITIELFGDEKWALGAGTLIITFLILVFSEITPKVIGAAHADRIAVVLAYLLWPMLRVAYPVVWFINLFSQGLLRLLRLKTVTGDEDRRFTADELRSIVAESSPFIPQHHRSILLNLFDLEHVTAADVMTPRGEIEAIDLAAPIEDIKTQLSTSYHTRVVAYETEPGNVVGILHQRRLLADAFAGDINESVLRAHLTEPYYVPAATPIYTQLQFFQESRQRFGLVVDEYGEIQGLITLEDIIEELVGKFTTRQADMGTPLVWDADGTVLVDGATTLRDLNRLLELDFSLEGPRTLNGLVIEHLQDIPEVGVGIRINGVPMEIVQTQDRKVKMLRLHRPASMDRCAD
jgi:Mg2+/Co2+ transporter CorB